MTTTISLPEPPAAVVARDPHWAAKMARLRARKLPERILSFVDDQALKQALSDAALALAKVRAAANAASIEQEVPEEQREEWVQAQPEVLAASAALDEAQRVLAEATLTLTFRGLPRPVWEQLLREHPPTEAQADAGMEYNVETFPAALISASHVERDEADAEVPGMSVEDAQELLDAWPDSEAKALFTAALMVNQTLRADLGKG
ncbi:hypothetical protein [Streptomyces sp. NBC_01262]|uniref:hypothetical protein n=1 Tax=Streptomyces sp. NBC_01262 TaxID=2903803 RepID=UPI002E30BD40|nr:hypothetical protein [Streptomyces sp. NBC_01262]